MNSYLCGVLLGDGCSYISKNKAFSVWIDQHNKNINILEKVKKIFQEDGYKIYHYKIPDNKQRVLTYSKKLYLEFRKIREDKFQGRMRPRVHFGVGKVLCLGTDTANYAKTCYMHVNHDLILQISDQGALVLS